ncbi:hypothetical protein B0H13DRAFT_2410276 [Mycena leptocephala]|nr:hypothetical protein B0H13DRAFT_2410276 [Mycena leptocephala]
MSHTSRAQLVRPIPASFAPSTPTASSAPSASPGTRTLTCIRIFPSSQAGAALGRSWCACLIAVLGSAVVRAGPVHSSVPALDAQLCLPLPRFLRPLRLSPFPPRSLPRTPARICIFPSSQAGAALGRGWCAFLIGLLGSAVLQGGSGAFETLVSPAACMPSTSSAQRKLDDEDADEALVRDSAGGLVDVAGGRGARVLVKAYFSSLRPWTVSASCPCARARVVVVGVASLLFSSLWLVANRLFLRLGAPADERVASTWSPLLDALLPRTPSDVRPSSTIARTVWVCDAPPSSLFPLPRCPLAHPCLTAPTDVWALSLGRMVA